MLTFLSIISWTVYVNSSNYVMIMMNSVEKIDNSLWPLVSFSPSYCISPAPRPLFLTECVSPLSFHHHLPHRVGKAISNIQAAHMYTYYTYKTHTHTLPPELFPVSQILCVFTRDPEDQKPQDLSWKPHYEKLNWGVVMSETRSELTFLSDWNTDLPVEQHTNTKVGAAVWKHNKG